MGHKMRRALSKLAPDKVLGYIHVLRIADEASTVLGGGEQCLPSPSSHLPSPPLDDARLRESALASTLRVGGNGLVHTRSRGKNLMNSLSPLTLLPPLFLSPSHPSPLFPSGIMGRLLPYWDRASSRGKGGERVKCSLASA